MGDQGVGTSERGRPRLEVPAHGTRNRYQHRTDPCHCRECTAANTLAVRTWRYTGVTRREEVPS